MNKSAAFEAGVRASFEKQSLLGLFKPKVPLKMSFKGHSKVLPIKPSTTVAPSSKVVTTSGYNPLAKKMVTQRHAGQVEGWT
jgi:hypothetical protein